MRWMMLIGANKRLLALTVLALASPMAQAKKAPPVSKAAKINGSRKTVMQEMRLPGLLDQAWGLKSTTGIDALSAWKEMEHKCPTSGVVVAVIDTGIDPKHPALKDSLWVNVKEAQGTPGVDDDKNGFVDDVSGWDFAKDSGQLEDTHGHGTHIAGIISANGQDRDNFKGVCPGVKIMSLRYYNERASGLVNLQNTVKSIDYAVAMGADIINYSGGGAEFSSEEYRALKRAEAKGILVVAAAGNERSDSDKRLYFPAAYDLENIVSVTAIDVGGNILNSSNWGKRKVHVAAPGNSIVSTAPGGAYQPMTGTSQATAFVSGIAAILMTERRTLQAPQLKRIIEASARRSEKLAGKAKTEAVANAVDAVRYLYGGARALSSSPVETTIAPREVEQKPRGLSTAEAVAAGLSP